MRSVTPKIFAIGETVAIVEGAKALFAALGVPDWHTISPTHSEGLIEAYGRLCYRSFAPGLNPNVTRVREGNKEYLANIIQQKHFSVFEHVSVNFVFLGVSRIFTHELVRHRVGTAISQESLRFVRLTELDFCIPEDIRANPRALQIFEEAIAAGEQWQKELAVVLGLEEKGTSFEVKKRLTSAMRRIAPEGLATAIGWTANFRTLRHVIELRTDPAAEWEIRYVFGEVAKFLINRYPNAFGDLTSQMVDGLPYYTSLAG
jgi:thymidylate synthase (FAD)